jgi:hypothetical protein
VLLAIGWLWTIVRQQQHAEQFSLGFDGGDGDPSLVDRVDLAFSSMFLLAYAGVVGGIAVGVSLLGRARPE